MGAPLPDLLLYGRPGCHLCEQTHATLLALLSERRATGRAAPGIREVDITTDADLLRAFGTRIPVVELAERRLELVTSPVRLRRHLEDILDRDDPLIPQGPDRA